MSTRKLTVFAAIAVLSLLTQACERRCTDHGTGSTAPMVDGGVSITPDSSTEEGRKPPADDLFHGIGWPCNSDADCNPGTYCDEWEQYCTSPCESSDDCEAQFGGFTKCRTGNLCAAECGRTEECHAFMECNTYTNYCYRAGTG